MANKYNYLKNISKKEIELNMERAGLTRVHLHMMFHLSQQNFSDAIAGRYPKPKADLVNYINTVLHSCNKKWAKKQQIINEVEVTGKTISRVVVTKGSLPDMYIFFTDDTFCIYSTYGFNYMERDHTPTRYNAEEVEHLGFITKEEKADLLFEPDKEIEHRQIQKDLKLLAVLKRKYPEA